eukprot:290762_1
MKVSKHVIYVIVFVMFCYIMVLYNINSAIENADQTDTLIHFGINDIHHNKPNKVIDLLIIMIDNRYTLLNQNNHHNINMTYLKQSYYYYSFCINFLYSNHHNYTLLLVDPSTNDSRYACNPIYYHNKQEKVPLEWCKLEILTYYLQNYSDIQYKWLLYLDADTHIIKFNTPFNKWLNYIQFKYSHYIHNINNIHFLLTNDTPRFIERELPRLQNTMKSVTNYKYNCDTYANAGVLFFRKSNISLQIMEEWAKSINKIPYRMLREFPREQGSLNCFVTQKYSKYIRLLPAFTEINIDWFYRDFSFVQHITSANWYWRTKRFKMFLNQLIESNKGNYSSICKQKTIVDCLPSFKILLKFIEMEDDVDNVLLKCVKMKHSFVERKYGNMKFVEHTFY